MRKKIALFCNTGEQDIIQNLTVESLYEAPLMMEREGLGRIVCNHLNLDTKAPDLSEWENMVGRMKNASREVTIGVVGKYAALPDAYLSLIEALRHAGINYDAKVNVRLIDSEEIGSDNVGEVLTGCDGVLVPGGFGYRGIEGKISAIHYARVNKLPYLGICLGMQLAVAEYSRNVLGLSDADSSEFDEEKDVRTTNPVIHIMPEQEDVAEKGGSMRLGLYPCKLAEGTIARELYGKELIYERHRHRYELNNKYRGELENNGMKLAGLSPNEKLVEIIELSEDRHPWFVGVQFHPEFKSRPNKPHPIFEGLIAAALKFGK